jgi:hypothetical protein
LTISWPPCHRSKLGEGFVIAPGLGILERRTFAPIRTWDSMRPPKEGEPAGPDTWMAVDLDAVRAEMSEIVREAEENDPVRLKAEIVRLKSEIQKAKSETIHPDPAELAAAEQRGYASAIAAINYKPRIVDLDQAIALLGSTESAVGKARANLIAGLDVITELPVHRPAPGDVPNSLCPDKREVQKRTEILPDRVKHRSKLSPLCSYSCRKRHNAMGQERPPALQKKIGVKARHAAPTAIGCPDSTFRG